MGLLRTREKVTEIHHPLQSSKSIPLSLQVNFYSYAMGTKCFTSLTTEMVDHPQRHLTAPLKEK